jgi:hypothetical protein
MRHLCYHFGGYCILLSLLEEQGFLPPKHFMYGYQNVSMNESGWMLLDAVVRSSGLPIGLVESVLTQRVATLFNINFVLCV